MAKATLDVLSGGRFELGSAPAASGTRSPRWAARARHRHLAGRVQAAELRLVGAVADGWIPSLGPASLDDLRFDGGVAAPPSFWAETFGQLEALGFDTVVFWPREPIAAQIERLAEAVS